MSRRWLGALAAGIGLALIGGLGSSIGRAQAPRTTPPLDPGISLVEQADCLAFGDARATRSPRTGAVRSVTTEAGRAIHHPRPLDALGSPEAAARSYLAVCASLFGLDRPTTQLALRAASNVLQVSDGGRVAGRRSILRFQQTHRNVPVIAGDLVVHLDEGNNIVFAGGKTLTSADVDTTATVDASDAAATAIAAVAQAHGVARQTLTSTAPELWIYDPILLGPEAMPARTVWRVEVTPRGLAPIRELVLVDAQRGSVALHFNQVETAQNRLTYTAGGTTTLPGTLVCDESNPTCSGGDADAVPAHQYAGDTYAFYSTRFGRDGIDNAGLTITSSVHYQVNYPNAFWNGTQMVYGDGFSKADDVVGHELTHGVTQYTSNLYYYYQSGAINESLSDVFGELIDLTNGHGNDDPSVRWLMGEDLPGGALRSMSDPTLFANPDRMTSTLWDPDLNGLDNGGVHTNSGVNNKAAFLMVDGGTFNGQTITGLGIDKVAKIYYEVQTHLLTTGSDYGDLYDDLYQACSNLVGTASITTADCQQVRNATLAVEMNQTAPGAIPEAALCTSGQAPTNVFFDNLENGAGNFVFGANIGAVRWTYDSIYFRYAHSGLHFLYADDLPATVSDSWVAMANSVTVPSNGFLHFAHADRFSQTTSDGGVVEYSTDGGASWTDAGPLFEANGYTGALSGTNPLAGRQAFMGTSRGYTSSRLKLSSLAGQNVKFRWRMALDSSGLDWGWWLDDVRVYSCPTGTVSADSVTPSSGTGATQTFAFQYSDTAGGGNVSQAWVFFTPSISSSVNTCLAYYDRSTNKMLLVNDAATTWMSGTPGSPGVLQNSQCSIALSGVSAPVSGNTTTLTVPIAFKPAFAGTKSVYMYASNYNGSSSGWSQRGSWTIPNAGPFTPTITWSAPANITYGTALGASQLNATASVPGTFVYSPPPGTILSAGSSQTLSVTFTPSDTTTYTTATATTTMTVQKVFPTITWPTPASIVVGTALGSAQLNATANVPGTFVYSPPAGTVLPLGNNQHLQVSFTPTDSTNYVGVSSGALINVISSASGTATAVSVTPSSGSGAAQSFDFTYSDGAGFSDIRVMWILITSPSNGTFLNTCLLQYDRTTSKLSLLNDNNTGWFQTAIPLSGLMQNSQCAVVLGGSSLFGSGNTLTLRLGMVFKSGYAGPKTIYMSALGMTQTSAPWQTMGSWTVSGTVAVTADSVTPSSGTGSTQSFALKYSDAAGFNEFASMWAWFSPSMSSGAANSCMAYYDPVALKLFFLNDAGTVWSSSSIPGVGTVQNSQCSIDLANSSVQGTGNSMTVNLRVTFASAYGGTKNIFMYASGLTGAASGWVQRGTWTIPGAGPITPTITWAAPANITYGTALGASQLNATANVPGTFAYTPAAGTILSAGSGQTLSVLFTPTDTTTYTTATKTTTINVLKATPTITWAAPANITAGTALSATQLNATANVPGTFTYSPPAGTVLSVGAGQTLSVTFTPTDGSNYSTATATVPITVVAVAVTVTSDSVTPSSGSGSTQTFSLQYGDTAGASDLTTAWVWFNTGGAGSSCLAYFNQGANALFLLNDAATAWMSGTIGSAATLQNAQCGIALSGVTASPSGTTLTLSVPVAFRPSFAGAKNVSMYAAGGNGANSGWQNRGTWTVPSGGPITPTITWPTPANIAVGTALSATQLNATANVPGTFVYTPPAGTVLGVGAGQTLSVLFTPTDLTTYTTATATVAITVVPAGATTVTADSVAPSSGSGASQMFTMLFSDTSGATDLATAWTWFSASLSGSAANSCLTYYNRAANTIFLLNDAGSAWTSGVPGGAGTLMNSQCAVALAGSSASPSGNTLSVGLAMTFTAGFSGAKNVYMFAANTTGISSGWQTRGAWTVPGAVTVTADSATPSSGGGASQPFFLQYSDTAGAGDLSTTWVWFNASLASSAASSCLVYYNRASNTMFLLNDAGTAWMPGTPGAAGTLQNSQCGVTLAATTIGVAGNALIVNAAMSFTPAFGGSKNIYMYAASAGGATSGWQNRGTWNVP